MNRINDISVLTLKPRIETENCETDDESSASHMTQCPTNITQWPVAFYEGSASIPKEQNGKMSFMIDTFVIPIDVDNLFPYASGTIQLEFKIPWFLNL